MLPDSQSKVLFSGNTDVRQFREIFLYASKFRGTRGTNSDLTDGLRWFENKYITKKYLDMKYILNL